MRHDVLTKEFVLPLWNERKIQVIDRFIAPDADIQTTFLSGRGPRALKLNAEETFNAFSSLEVTIDHVIQRGPKLIYQWQARAIHTGPLFNTPASDKIIHFAGVTLAEVQEELITQYHSFTNIPQVLAANQRLIYSKEPSNNEYFDREHLIAVVKNATGKRLTLREIECLSFWLKGFSIKSTAKILGGLSCRTIQTFRENIKRKLNVETYQQLFGVIQECGIMPIFLENINYPEPYLDIFEIQPILLDASSHT
jgi:DNA-binding CsgD family transcriptional regulator/predicted ester cyclase